MHAPLLLFFAVAAAIFGLWSWIGAPVAMPPSPLGANEKLFCVSYAPFRGDQSPLEAGTHVSAAQIDADLARLARTTGCVRTYSVEHGLDQVPALAGKYGLKVMQGIWLSSQRTKNAAQIESAIALANRHRDTISAVIVGNEVLLRGELSPNDVAAALGRVKAAVPVPVTYADVWEFWLRNRDLAAVADVVTIHILPYWEDFPVSASEAAGHVDVIRKRAVEAFPGKEVLIGEMGWPSAGRMREGALPSPVNQARVLHEVLNRAKAGGYRVNIIEAFDQPWKRALEGTVGGHWGLYDDRTREAKFAWGIPLSNHPNWFLQAIGGITLAALVFLAAGIVGGIGLPPSRWAIVAGMAFAAGAPSGLTVVNIPLESFGWGGWLRALVLAAVALLAPALAAAALARGMAPPRFAALLGGAADRSRDPLALAVGAASIVTCVVGIQAALGLVFDPRYKDFPYAPMVAAVFAFFALANSARPAQSGERGHAELIAAGLLGLCAAYIALNEGFANWQAQFFAAILGLQALTLLQIGGARRRG